jgi:predicted AlkP superfamily phosphohydrolase/phosphomutase
MNGARTLIVGLDGATWKVAEPLIAQGKLPNLAMLKKSGCWSWLNSTTPPMTLPSWSSMLTGCNPGRHGIFDFVHYQDQSLRFVHALDRCVPTIHQIISDRGGRVASLLVPTTWPPVPIDGVMISGFDSPVSTDIDASFCHPSTLYKQLRQRFGSVHFADIQESNIQEGWHEQALPRLLQEVHRKEKMGAWLLRQERWDCFMLLFGESDTVSHHFWMFHDPQSPRFRNVRVLRDSISRVYQRLDQALGVLIESAKPDWICVCSDHGFGGAGEHVLYLNQFLAEQGWLTQKKESRLAPLRRKIAQKVPHSILGHVFRNIPSSLRNQLESRARYGGIDFNQTRAFSDEMNYAATIRMPSMVGFDRLKEHLLRWKVDGHYPVREVYTRDDLYCGEAVDRSAEVILELNLREEYSYTLLSSGMAKEGQTWRTLSSHEHMGGKGLGMNGTHRQHGVLCLYGTDVPSQEVQADMKDITPTLLHLMGEAVPTYMDGSVLMEDAQVSYCSEESSSDVDGVRMTSTQSQAIRERLKRLGYL